MNKEQSLLLKLVKQSQFGATEKICIDGINMDALYAEAVEQSVLGLIAPEITSIYLSDKYSSVFYLFKSAYILYCTAENELKNTLECVNIPFVILKGNASACYYKEPFLRSMGDIDFIVPQDLCAKAIDVLIANGYDKTHDNGRHISFKKDKQVFELHRYYSIDIDIEDYLIEDFNNLEIVSIDGFEFPMFPKLTNGLILLEHFRRHLQKAVGLRHVIDWMMYVYHNLDDEFWFNEFQSVASEKGMDTLAITVTKMCQLYLGLPDTIKWCKNADDEICKQLLDLILLSGNFGNKTGSGGVIEAVSSYFKRDGFFRRLQYAGKINWKAYQKHHWLKPFCWIYQLLRYLKRGLISGRKYEQIKDDFERGKNRAELLRKLNVI